MQEKKALISLCVVFVILFVTLLTAIIINTVSVVKHWDEPKNTTEQTTTAVLESEISTQEDTTSSDTTEVSSESYDPPEDIEYIRDDLPERQKTRLDEGRLFEPMDRD